MQGMTGELQTQDSLQTYATHSHYDTSFASETTVHVLLVSLVLTNGV